MAIAAAITLAGCSGEVRIDGGDEEAQPWVDPGDEAVQPGGDALAEPGEQAATLGCGNGVCTPNESCTSCPQDCGACPCAHDLCATGDALDPSCDPCAAQVCAVDSFCCTYMWDAICVSEVGSVCGSQCVSTCGNGQCDASETCSSCPQDCGACPACGDGSCNGAETCSTCAQDCGPCPGCGNGVCTPNESCTSCPQDCGACPCAHDVCQTGGALDPACSPCVAQICAVDPFCCTASWDAICVGEVGSVCGQACGASCGDWVCDPTESCSSCAQDCGACPACGDGWCGQNESCAICPQDCGACPSCGNGQCEQGENCTNCAGDCGACPACPAADLGSTVPQTVTGSTAGLPDSSPAPCGAPGGPDVAYSFTAPADGTYEFNTVGSSFDTVLHVHEGTCQGAVLACDDDSAGGFKSKVILPLTAGQAVVIVVDGWAGSQGAFTLNIL